MLFCLCFAFILFSQLRIIHILQMEENKGDKHKVRFTTRSPRSKSTFLYFGDKWYLWREFNLCKRYAIFTVYNALSIQCTDTFVILIIKTMKINISPNPMKCSSWNKIWLGIRQRLKSSHLGANLKACSMYSQGFIPELIFFSSFYPQRPTALLRTEISFTVMKCLHFFPPANRQ